MFREIEVSRKKKYKEYLVCTVCVFCKQSADEDLRSGVISKPTNSQKHSNEQHEISKGRTIRDNRWGW